MHQRGASPAPFDVDRAWVGCSITTSALREGFVHDVVIRGMTLARMEHTFRKVPGGMIDENCLIIPGSHRLAFLSRVLVPRNFPEPKGRAWLKHSIEEMGTLENFLPDLYAREVKASGAMSPARVS